ncbi:mucin isoform X1 [Paramuricea clavata]|uniref:Mucin isoform X1 n=1 Tax=Paramuricea clavata TaxID=317549 RepID=A0A6S7FRM5_PARCT|nr:mucin isoform X1 [Paramuricea clavata]
MSQVLQEIAGEGKKGSVGITYLALFDPTTIGLTSNSLNSELEAQLNTANKETSLGPFQLKKTSSGNALTFTDVNECLIDSPCHTNAKCNNTEGSYSCTCDIGYSGDGYSCDGKNETETVIVILFKHILLQTFSPRASLIKGDYVRLFTKLVTSKQKGLHQKELHQSKDQIIIVWKNNWYSFSTSLILLLEIYMEEFTTPLFYKTSLKRVIRPETALHLE